MIKNKTIISLAAFSSLALLGLLFPSVGSSLPAIEKFYSVSLSSSGRITSLVQLGYAVFCFMGGMITDYSSKRNVLIGGTFLYGISGIALGYSTSWMITLILFLLIGTASGLIFIASNTLVIDMYRGREGTFLNIHHTFFALGSLLSPLIVSSLLMSGSPWTRVFQLLGLISLLICFILIFSNVSSFISEHSYRENFKFKQSAWKYWNVLKLKKFRQLLVIGFLALGVQFGIIYLLVSFLMKVRLIIHHEASLVMSAFFGLLLFGRVICSYLASKYSAAKVILMLLFFLSVTITLGWITDGNISKIMFGLTGLASSGLMPTLLALANSTLSIETRGAALGFLSMAGGLGGMIVTLIISGFAEYLGFNISFLLLLLLSFGTTIYFFYLRKEFT